MVAAVAKAQAKIRPRRDPRCFWDPRDDSLAPETTYVHSSQHAWAPPPWTTFLHAVRSRNRSTASRAWSETTACTQTDGSVDGSDSESDAPQERQASGSHEDATGGPRDFFVAGT